MKVLLYSEGKKLFSKSGVGRALKHQMIALEKVGVAYTTDEEDNYDLAHINTIGPGGEKVLKKSRKSGLPVIYHTHTTFEDFRNSFMFSNSLAPLIKSRIKRLYSSADFLISPSEYTRDLVRGYGVNLPIKVISNGVDNEKFSRNAFLAESFRKQYGIEGPLVISVGLPFSRKGVVDFCDIAANKPDIRFFWFGAKITSLLPAKIKKLLNHPPKNVIFPGFVPQETIMGAYSACDAFFFPSYEENEGIVVLEALSMEAPILIRDIPVYRGWMRSEENCLKGRDNRELSLLLDRLVADKKLAGKLTSTGKETALERDLSIIGQKLKNTYLEVLEKR